MNVKNLIQGPNEGVGAIALSSEGTIMGCGVESGGLGYFELWDIENNHMIARHRAASTKCYAVAYVEADHSFVFPSEEELSFINVEGKKVGSLFLPSLSNAMYKIHRIYCVDEYLIVSTNDCSTQVFKHPFK
jgi:hypothetical protein